MTVTFTACLFVSVMAVSPSFSYIPGSAHQSVTDLFIIYAEDTNTLAMNEAENRMEKLEKKYFHSQKKLTIRKIKKARILLEKARYNLTGHGIGSFWSDQCDSSCQKRSRYVTLVQQFQKLETLILNAEKELHIQFVRVHKKQPVYKAG